MFANSDRLLLWRDKDFGFFAVDFDFGDFGWAEGFADVFGGVVAPGDNVNFFFVADFVHDGLDADATTTHEGTNGVDAWYGGDDRNFSTTARFSGDAFDFDGVVFEFRDFLAEETFDKFGRTTAEDELGTPVTTLNFFDEDFDTATDTVEFAVDLFGTRHDATTAANIDTNEFRLDTSDGTGNDGADFIFVFIENGVVFGFAEALNDNLFGSTGGNATKRSDFLLFFDGATDFGVFAGFTLGNFGRGVIGEPVLDDFASDIDIGFAGVGVQNGANVHIAVAVVFAPSGGDGLFDNTEDSLSRETFFFGNDVNHGGHLL